MEQKKGGGKKKGEKDAAASPRDHRLENSWETISHLPWSFVLFLTQSTNIAETEERERNALTRAKCRRRPWDNAQEFTGKELLEK